MKKKKLEIVYVDINKIVPWENNPKDHNIDAIIASIEEFDVTQPILVQAGTNKIIAGHGRYEAFKHLNIKKIPVMYKKISDGKAKALALVDNQTTMMRTWDDEKYELAIEEIQLEYPEFKFETYEFDMPEPEIEKEDEIPALPKKAKTKKGDLYILDGKHRIMCGDSTKKKNIKRLMGGKKADMVFTDPPYGIKYKDLKDKFEKIINDNLKDSEFTRLLISAIPSYPKVHYICCNWMSYAPFLKALFSMKIIPKALIVWDKVNPAQNLDKFFKSHEFVIYSGPFGGEKTVAGDVWQIKRRPSKHHPTQKPLELVAKAIQYSSPKLIYDPFLGSGTTLIASQQLNRTCYGMEIDPAYVDVILERYKNYKKSKGEKAVIKKVKK